MEVVKVGTKPYYNKMRIDCAKCGAVLSVTPEDCRLPKNGTCLTNCPCCNHSIQFMAPFWFLSKITW